MPISIAPETLEGLIDKSIRDKATAEEEALLLTSENVDIYIHELERVSRDIAAQLLRRKAEMQLTRQKLSDDRVALYDAEKKYMHWATAAKKIHDAAATKAVAARNRAKINGLLKEVAAYLDDRADEEAKRLLTAIKEMSPDTVSCEDGADKEVAYDEF